LEHFKKSQGNLEFHQNKCHLAMYVTQRDIVQRPLASGPGGGRSSSFCVSLDQNFLDTCLHEKGKVMAAEKVDGC
jgi:hypothetical protein